MYNDECRFPGYKLFKRSEMVESLANRRYAKRSRMKHKDANKQQVIKQQRDTLSLINDMIGIVSIFP